MVYVVGIVLFGIGDEDIFGGIGGFVVGYICQCDGVVVVYWFVVVVMVLQL